MFVLLIPFMIILFFIAAAFIGGCFTLVKLMAKSITVFEHPKHGLSVRETWAIRFALAGGSLSVFFVNGTPYDSPTMYVLLGILLPLVTLAIAATDRPEWFGVLGTLGMALHLLVLNAGTAIRTNDLSAAQATIPLYINAGLGFLFLGWILATPFKADVEHRKQWRRLDSSASL